MKDTRPKLSMVIPVRDELDSIPELLERMVAALDSACAGDFEVIFVDDGSVDGSADLLARRCQEDSRLVLVRLRRPFGKGEALAAGIDHASGEVIGTFDADLQEDPAEIGLLLARLRQGAELVIGWRRERRDSLAKRISSRLFNGLIRLSGGPPLKDSNCGFKVMDRRLAADLPLSGGRFRLIGMVAAYWGYRVAQVPVSHKKREHGHSHFGSERFPGAVLDLIAVRALLRAQSRPGHRLLQLGLTCSAAGGIICAWIAWLRLAEGTIGHRYPLLALGVLLLVLGGQMILAGVIGEWLAWKDRSRRRGYRLIEETVSVEEEARN
ncbi:MAG TPA: glycosyltransferase [Planctomycetes bacterium]|nr:glycosyltransferase [Planctomycetota bacterium]HIN80901.1 glycosyltransferase [Planctomycetota bacterium]